MSATGGGLNFERPKFSDIIDRIVRGALSPLVIAPPDRLARFGCELLEHGCETHDGQLERRK